jgi:alpha-tubulin suppressor-like RCC1 family protein
MTGWCQHGWGRGQRVMEEGVVWAFGGGEHGRLGLNDEDDRLVPRRVGPQSFGGAQVATVAAGAYHWAAVSEGGALFPGARVKRTQMMLDLRCPAASATQTCVPCHGSGCVSRRQ